MRRTFGVLSLWHFLIDWHACCSRHRLGASDTEPFWGKHPIAPAQDFPASWKYEIRQFSADNDQTLTRPPI